jgi:hypothetical protein
MGGPYCSSAIYTLYYTASLLRIAFYKCSIKLLWWKLETNILLHCSFCNISCLIQMTLAEMVEVLHLSGDHSRLDFI